MGSVYRRGSRYWVKFKDARGNLVRKTAGTTRVEPVRLLRDLEPTRESRGRAVYFESVLDSYRDYLGIHAKPNTLRQSESSFRRLLEAFAGLDTRDLGPLELDRFIQHRRADGVTPRTINGDLIVLRAILNHGVRVGMLTSLPIRVRLLKAPRKRVV